MKIKDYTWDTFEIAKENHVDIGVGKDMFIANLEQKKAAYHGADHLDYEALGEAWAAMTGEEKTEERELFRKVTAVSAAGGWYKALTAARQEQDRKTFEQVVAEAVAALKAPSEAE